MWQLYLISLVNKVYDVHLNQGVWYTSTTFGVSKDNVSNSRQWNRPSLSKAVTKSCDDACDLDD